VAFIQNIPKRPERSGHLKIWSTSALTGLHKSCHALAAPLRTALASLVQSSHRGQDMTVRSGT